MIYSAQNYLVDGLELSQLQISFPLYLFLEYNKFGRVQYEDLSPLAKLKSDEHSDEKFLSNCANIETSSAGIAFASQKLSGAYNRKCITCILGSIGVIDQPIFIKNNILSFNYIKMEIQIKQVFGPNRFKLTKCLSTKTNQRFFSFINLITIFSSVDP